MPLSIVILAAGQGKRMKSDLPKVLQPLAGQPLLSHVLDDREGAARRRDPRRATATAASGCKQALADEPVNWVLQAEQLGTGHAVAQAMPAIPDDHRRADPVRRRAAGASADARAAASTQCGAQVARRAHRRARRSDRLRPRRARRRRQRRAHRRAEGREHQGARDPRDQHRARWPRPRARCAAGWPR